MRLLVKGLPRPLQVVAGWAVTIAIAVAVVLTLRAEVASPYRIPTSSMEPTLHCARPSTGCRSGSSDRILANRFIYRFRDPRRGEIVVFRTPPATRHACGEGGTFVKRIVGVPGDVVELREGALYLNGTRLAEAYVATDPLDRTTKAWPVPADSYFMMGDNRGNSCDSRSWGTVPRRHLIGPVFLTYWPPARLGSP